MGGGEYIYTILGLGVRWQLHSPSALPPEKEPKYSFDMFDGVQSQTGCRGEEKNPLHLPRIESLLSSLQPVAIPTEIS
jgi:hypothetical protein